jgi:hypothetical protein
MRNPCGKGHIVVRGDENRFSHVMLGGLMVVEYDLKETPMGNREIRIHLEPNY